MDIVIDTFSLLFFSFPIAILSHKNVPHRKSLAHKSGFPISVTPTAFIILLMMVLMEKPLALLAAKN